MGSRTVACSSGLRCWVAEGEGEVVAGVAFVFVEDEAVDGDGEPDRDVAEDVEGGC